MDRDYEYELYKHNVQIGLDGSVLRDDDMVYVPNSPLCQRCQQIDYFHGMQTVPIAQTCDELDIEVWHMITVSYRALYPVNMAKRFIAFVRVWRVCGIRMKVLRNRIRRWWRTLRRKVVQSTWRTLHSFCPY